MATVNTREHVNKLIFFPERQFAIQAGDGLTIKDVIFLGEFVDFEVKKKKKHHDLAQKIDRRLKKKKFSEDSYKLVQKENGNIVVCFEDKNLAEKASEKLKMSINAKAFTIDQLHAKMLSLETGPIEGTSKSFIHSGQFSIFLDNYEDPYDELDANNMSVCSICCNDFVRGEMIDFECGHFFCSLCIYNTVFKGIELGKINFKCPENSSNCQAINWSHVDLVLSRLSSTLEATKIWKFLSILLVNKLRLFLVDNPLYHFCNGPDCTALHVTDHTQDGDYFLTHYCEICNSVRCAACGFDPHKGDCIFNRGQVLRLLTEGAINPHASQILCVNDACRAPIEKKAGCDHIECTQCGWHFCFRCLKFMAKTPREIYEHMRKVHGNYGQLEIPVPNPLQDAVLREVFRMKKVAEKHYSKVLTRFNFKHKNNYDFFDAHIKDLNPQERHERNLYCHECLYDEPTDYKNELLRFHIVTNAHRFLKNTKFIPENRIFIDPLEHHKKVDNSDQNFWKNFSHK